MINAYSVLGLILVQQFKRFVAFLGFVTVRGLSIVRRLKDIRPNHRAEKRLDGKAYRTQAITCKIAPKQQRVLKNVGQPLPLSIAQVVWGVCGGGGCGGRCGGNVWGVCGGGGGSVCGECVGSVWGRWG